jgi:cobalt-zinc-cadmium efflux system membrane fusion protein
MSADVTAVVAPRESWFVRVRHVVPNVLAFSLLAAVMYVGHHTGWKLPKLSELRGGDEPAADNWCAEHLVPETACVLCNADLHYSLPSFGFCRVHGVAECVNDHPELAQTACELQLPKYDTAAAIALMDRRENNPVSAVQARLVQFASIAAMEKAGVEADYPAIEQSMSDVISASGEMSFDPRRVAHLSPKVPGTVALVLKNVGDEVHAGDVLALVDAAQVGQAKSNPLQAIVQLQLKTTTLARLESVANSGAVPLRVITEAKSELQAAEIGVISSRQALTNLGLKAPENLETADARRVADDLRFIGVPEELVATLPEAVQTANLIPVRAPYDGVVVASEVVAGEVVAEADALFTVADPRRLWLILSVRQEDAKYVKPGQPVKFQPDDGGDEVTGAVSWISPAVDEQTRTLDVRVSIDNSAGTLRDKTFGAGRIVIREEPSAVVVPLEAVQATTDSLYVFVRDKNFLKPNAPKVFHVRQVRVGARNEEFAEILAGVLPGEIVATRGSAVILAQLLRGSMGAACGCYDD